MGSFIGSVVLHTTDTERGAAFWQHALGYVSSEDNVALLVPPEWTPPSRTRHDHGDGMHVHLDRGDNTHLDLWVNDGDSLESEVERLVALGATRVEWDYPEEADYVVLADPDGNLFCVVA
jgi:catechol 2,3-dioxygenase-like lactoylglutathione lyase family enzyme